MNFDNFTYIKLFPVHEYKQLFPVFHVVYVPIVLLLFQFLQQVEYLLDPILF